MTSNNEAFRNVGRILFLIIALLMFAAGSGERECTLPVISDFIESILKTNGIVFSVSQHGNSSMITINQPLSKDDCEKLIFTLHEAIINNDNYKILPEKRSINWVGKFEDYPLKSSDDINVNIDKQTSIGSGYNLNDEYWIKIHGSIKVSGEVFKERYVEHCNFNYQGLNARCYILIYDKEYKKKYLSESEP